jgi:hypothetical protein
MMMQPMQPVYQYVPSGGVQAGYGQGRMMKGQGGIHNKMRQTKQNVMMHQAAPIESRVILKNGRQVNSNQGQ